MIKEIKYNGYSANPSDYECADGDLATTMGLIQEDGTMKPVLPPSVRAFLPNGYNIVHIHKNSSYTNYIVRKGNEFYWFSESIISNAPITIKEDNLNKIDIPSITLHQINSIGNVLLFLSTDGMFYVLWQDGTYSYLGNHLPELSLSFGLQGTCKVSDSFNITYDQTVSYDNTILSAQYSEAAQNVVTSQVLAKVNKFIADNYTNGNKFLYPFFVRYAYRLYDGSLTMHSAPILMICSTGQTPYVLGGNAKQTDNGWDGTWDSQSLNGCRVYGALYQLDFAVIDEDDITELKKWSDIISSVDVFISAPLYTYDQSGKCTGVDVISNGKIGGRTEFCVCKATHGGDYSKYYQYHSALAMLLYGRSELPGWSVRLPLKNSLSQTENIKNASQFYFLKSYKLDSLTTERKIVDIEDGHLQSLVTREVMSDDYDSHATLIPQYSYNYNSRLNITGLTRVLPRGFHMSSLLCYTNGFLQPKNGHISEGIDNSYEDTQMVSMFIYIKKQEKTIVVRSLDYSSLFLGDFGADVGQFTPTPYLYYPDVDAYKAVIFWHKWVSGGNNTGEVRVFREINLEPHAMLNGAVYFNGWEMTSGKDVSESNVNKGSDNVQPRSISVPNKIYTSEVNNPFSFPVLGINTVGTGNILGICAAAKALSEGQFGQFPLYAFTSEGVWALEVSATGTYSAKQPITRDVVINPDSITQIDSAVLFATDRGIMHISGSTVQCISDRLNTEEMFNIADLPKCDKLINIFNGKADESEQITLDDISLLPFNEFLQGCRMVYDYTNQRIIVYNPAVRYAYVYSLKSQTWGMMRSDIVDNVNSYPEALAMADGAKLVDFSKPVAENITALIITRPFKIDDPNMFKTINTIIQRGMFRSTHVQQVLYGSNDLIHWHTVWSSVDKIMRGFRGTPYKAFRLALVCKFDRGESIYGCTVVYEPRMTNQVR